MAIQRAARAGWAGIVRCYRQHGKGQCGTIELSLEISSRGKVAGARRVSSTLNDDVASSLARVSGE